MAFTDVFGGELLFPSQTSYISITTAVDVTLQWPREQQIGGVNIVADFIDLDASVPSLNIDMPSASFTSTGNKTTFNNLGANTFTVRDNTGGTIQSVQPGEQWVLVLTDNGSTAGLWSTFQLGGNAATQASASALAGDGLRPMGQQLDQIIDSDVEASTPFTVVDGDRAKCLIYTAGAGTCNLPSPGAVANNWFFMLRNSGNGTLNVLPPSGTIDGGSSINMDTNDAVFIFTDGTNFFTIGFGQGNTLAFDFVEIAVPGSGDFNLSGVNLDRISYRFTGVLTGNRRIVVPDTIQQYWVDNQTTGAFTLEISTSLQVGPPTVGQGNTVIFYADAVDVINAVNTAAVSFPILVTQGGTGATTASAARANLGAAFDGQDMIAGVGMTGGGTLAADRTFDVTPIGLDDLTDVTLTAPSTGGVLYKSAGDWLDTNAVQIDPAAAVSLRHNGAVRIATVANGAQIDSSGSLGAVTLFGSASVAQFFTEYNTTNGGVALKNQNPGGRIFQISAGGGEEDIWIDMVRNGLVAQYHNNTQMTRTVVIGSGGFEVNNTVTGAGFERALTTSDIPGSVTSLVATGVFLTTSMVNDSDMTIALVAGDYLIEAWLIVQSNGTTDNYEVTIDWTGAVNDKRGITAIGPDSTTSGVAAGIVQTTGGPQSAAAIGMNFPIVNSSTLSSLVRVWCFLDANGAGTVSVRQRKTGATDTMELVVGSRMLITPVV